MRTRNERMEIKQLEASQTTQDELLVKNTNIKRRNAWEGKLRSATAATKLYQQYKNSPEQFRMTFAEFKRSRRRTND